MSEETSTISGFYAMGERVRVTAGEWDGWLGSTLAYAQLGTDAPGTYAVRLVNNVVVEVASTALVGVEVDEITALDILRGAPTIIRERGWHQGSYFDEAQHAAGTPIDACKVCAIGAMGAVGGDGPGGDWSPAMNAALVTLRSWLSAQNVLPDSASIADWNDTEGRTVEHVISALEGAAQLATVGVPA